MRSRWDTLLPKAAATTAAVVALSALAACSNSEPKATKDGDRPFIINVNGPLSDPFFGSVKLGADDAAKALDVEYEYSAPRDLTNLGTDMATLLNRAAARKPDAIVIANLVPPALDPVIKEITDSGIPVVMQTNGRDTFPTTGAIGYVGKSYIQTGIDAGEAAAELGVTNFLCINTAPANPSLHDQCEGARESMEKAGGAGDELQLPTSTHNNAATIQQQVQGYLSSHKDIDGVWALGEIAAEGSVAAVEALGKSGEIMVTSTNVSQSILEQIKSGAIAFTIDQQPYLQGYGSMQVAAQYVEYKIYPTQPIETSGLVITQDNVDEVLTVQASHPGLRGAK